MRVITGKARGVALKTPEGMETRPTSDRVKEALFSIINFDIQNTCASFYNSSKFFCAIKFKSSQNPKSITKW